MDERVPSATAEFPTVHERTALPADGVARDEPVPGLSGRGRPLYAESSSDPGVNDVDDGLGGNALEVDADLDVVEDVEHGPQGCYQFERVLLPLVPEGHDAVVHHPVEFGSEVSGARLTHRQFRPSVLPPAGRFSQNSRHQLRTFSIAAMVVSPLR